MQEVILVRFGEIFLKGKNYIYFENTLFKNVKNKLSKYNLTLDRTVGRFIVSNFDQNDKNDIIEDLKTVFGLVSISVAKEIETSFENIKEECSKIVLGNKSFKIETKRADKKFEYHSMYICQEMGHEVLVHNPDSTVDVHSPQVTVNIDIRQNGKTYIYYDKIACLGGMPLSTAGRGMVLLSGGIDSPVAAFLMAKRGLSLNAIHFHSYPYTSEQAKQKVIDLANIIKKYTGNINLFIVPFTRIQEEIHKNCDDEYMVTIVRRFMMDIAERLAQKTGCSCLITGENLGQVASQTVAGITSTNLMAHTLPVFRPLISFDKVEISNIAEKIGTYQTSILPYEDCCSVFLPKNPVTHPKLDKILRNEELLDRETLIQQAIDNVELLKINN